MQPTSIQYKLLLIALSPLAFIHIIYRSIKDGGWRYFKQRLGFSYPEFDERPIHFHCASVGEFITAKPLIYAIHTKYSDKSIIVTTNTPTAASLVRKLNNDKISHSYLPIDLSLCVNRFLKASKPRCSIILETEIWPTLYSCCALAKSPIAIVNARLSKKTFEANKIIKSEYARALKNTHLVLTRSQEDYENYLKLGSEKDKTHVIGNLKYAVSNTNNHELACTTIKRPFFLAASTHEGEELQLAQHIELLKRKNYLLILAPRYPDRCKQLTQQLRDNGLQVSVRGLHGDINSETDVYIVDTLGELNMFFNEAALVFIGGSLIPRGGHNMLEPASFAKCVVVGPHTDNFSLETSEMLQADAIIQVKDNHALGVKLVRLLKEDTTREKFGKNALHFVKQKSEILNSYENQLQVLIKPST